MPHGPARRPASRLSDPRRRPHHRPPDGGRPVPAESARLRQGRRLGEGIMNRRTVFVCVALAATITATTAAAHPGGHQSGFKTAQPAMLTAVAPDVTVTPLMTVGDVLPSGYRFEAIPDGISVRPRGRGSVDLYINHETSKVPFPYVTAAPTAANGENDFDNAQVSQLTLNQHSAGVLNGSFAISSSVGLPALLLELPGDVAGIVHPGDPLHERGIAGLRAIGRRIPGRRRPATRRSARRAWSSRSTSGPGSIARSTGWAGTTTRTTSRSPGITGRWSSRATTRSRAVR